MLPEDIQNELRETGLYEAAERFAANGRVYPTDVDEWERFLALNNEALREVSPEQLKASLRWRLNDGDWRYAEARHRQANGLATPKDRQVMSMADRLENGWRQVQGKKPTEQMTEEDRNRLQLVRQALDLEVQAFTAAKSREPDDVETQVLIDKLLLDRVEQAGWGGEVLPVGAMKPDEFRGAEVNGKPFSVEAIPAAERRRITFDLQRRRMSVSQQNVVDQWVAEGMPGKPEGMTWEKLQAEHPSLQYRDSGQGGQFAEFWKAHGDRIQRGTQPPAIMPRPTR